MNCLVYFERVIRRQKRYGIVDFRIVEDFMGNLVEGSGRLPWLCNYRMLLPNLQSLEALCIPCIAPLSSIVPFVSLLFSARSAASFLPMNLFLGCLCFCWFSGPSSASTAPPRSTCARSSSILTTPQSRCYKIPGVGTKGCVVRSIILDLRVGSVKLPMFPANSAEPSTPGRQLMGQVRPNLFRGLKPLVCYASH